MRPERCGSSSLVTSMDRARAVASDVRSRAAICSASPHVETRRHADCSVRGSERRQTKMKRTFAFLLLLPLVAPPAWAATRETGDYGPTDKLSRGVANVTTGVLAFPGTIAQKTQEDGASGVPVGIGMGLYRVVARELVGVYDLVTFPLPQPNEY